MSHSATQPVEASLALSASAPRVRITAGVGSAGQKTWNLRRPVTLIGSRRPSHIVLHDRDIANAHCIIVNTGTDVLIKDLHTARGTLCNGRKIDLEVLADGDVLTVGTASIQIAIRVSNAQADDSGCGLEFDDPMKLSNPAPVRLQHTDRKWMIEQAVAMIGRHHEAAIPLDDESVSTRHAVLFRYGKGLAVFDLGSRTGTALNGPRCNVSRVADGDQVGIGRYTLLVGPEDQAVTDTPPVPSPESCAVDSSLAAPAATGDTCTASSSAAAAASPLSSRSGFPSPAMNVSLPNFPSVQGVSDPEQALGQIESKLGALEGNIAQSWDRLNSWEGKLREDASALDKKQSSLHSREEELEAKQAALRGQLHDLARYHEELSAREQELSEQLAKIQVCRDEALAMETSCQHREEAVARKAQELQRREHVVAQRWTRLLGATCPHCSRPVSDGTNLPTGP